MINIALTVDFVKDFIPLFIHESWTKEFYPFFLQGKAIFDASQFP